MLLISFPSWIPVWYSTTVKLTLHLIQDTIWQRGQHKSKNKTKSTKIKQLFLQSHKFFLCIYLTHFHIFFIYWFLNYLKIEWLKLLLIPGRQYATPSIIHLYPVLPAVSKLYVQVDCKCSLNGNVENIVVQKNSSELWIFKKKSPVS